MPGAGAEPPLAVPGSGSPGGERQAARPELLLLAAEPRCGPRRGGCGAASSLSQPRSRPGWAAASGAAPGTPSGRRGSCSSGRAAGSARERCPPGTASMPPRHRLDAPPAPPRCPPGTAWSGASLPWNSRGGLREEQRARSGRAPRGLPEPRCPQSPPGAAGAPLPLRVPLPLRAPLELREPRCPQSPPGAAGAPLPLRAALELREPRCPSEPRLGSGGTLRAPRAGPVALRHRRGAGVSGGEDAGSRRRHRDTSPAVRTSARAQWSRTAAPQRYPSSGMPGARLPVLPSPAGAPALPAPPRAHLQPPPPPPSSGMLRSRSLHLTCTGRTGHQGAALRLAG
uniref:basic proline-rich protein-like n=1 Tax=Agelaius phoeniceus TaxID=39638 RepID=UPI0023ED2107|nr:basic proline-rich protein-like [Agelaius phoeniceus]